MRLPARFPVSPHHLQRYFASGWAFLIPYLAAYLLYYVTGWPANPPTDAAAPFSAPSPFNLHSSPFLPLLHLYWILHAVHLVLAALALRTWWRDNRTAARPTATSDQPPPSVLQPQLSHINWRIETLLRLAPWAILALIFYIPGVYLEWPSDPWEHLRRINEWRILDTVGAHSSWHKSSYFIPYSLLSWCTGLRQLFWLDFYYTGICLLLCWQYYKFARACGLGERASMVFVIVQALLFGNNIFSFYRYYGISSSIYAQLGAIALTRIVLEFAARGTSLGAGLQEETKETDTPVAHGIASTIKSPLRALLATQYSLLISVPSLIALIAFNHIQGIGIAGIGIVAIIVWRLIEWKRAMLFWLVGAAVIMSIAVVLWFPRDPALDTIFRPEGWLNGWYGFNLFAPSAPAFERSLHILGFLGLANAFLGFLLIVRRNDLAGWLPLIPLIVLALPCFALPISSLLASEKSIENIITFQRLLFAVPLPLALVATSADLSRVCRLRARDTTDARLARTRAHLLASFSHSGLLVILVGLLALVTLAPDVRSFNRFWQAILIPPKDLQLDLYIATDTIRNAARQLSDDTLLVNTPLDTEAKEAFVPNLPSHQFRQIHASDWETEIASRTEKLIQALSSLGVHNLDPTILSGGSPAHMLIRRAERPVRSKNRLIADLTAIDVPWLTLGGHQPHSHQRDGKIVLGNAVGRTSHVFNAEMIPVQVGNRYLLSATVRQTSGTGTNYLAVAWYDQTGRFLVASEPLPEGAGRPDGWAAGTYSYYGLVNQTAAPEWTRYTISFGLGETAEIPRNAALMRAGSLLNETHTPHTSAELTQLILWEKPGYQQVQLVAPDFRSLVTSRSQAALLSGHWSPQYVAVQQMGTRELRALFQGGPHRHMSLNPVSD